MANCYLCGANQKNSELEPTDGVSFEGVMLPYGQMMCVDAQECDAEREAKSNEYWETPDDTPCLDAPWWSYR